MTVTSPPLAAPPQPVLADGRTEVAPVTAALLTVQVALALSTVVTLTVAIAPVLGAVHRAWT
jgi:hypothetical protein